MIVQLPPYLRLCLSSSLLHSLFHILITVSAIPENANYLYPDHAPLSVVTYTSEVCLACRNKGKGPHHQTAALVSNSVPSFRIASTGHFTEEAPALYQLLEGLQGLVTRKFEKLREQVSLVALWTVPWRVPSATGFGVLTDSLLRRNRHRRRKRHRRVRVVLDTESR